MDNDESTGRLDWSWPEWSAVLPLCPLNRLTTSRGPGRYSPFSGRVQNFLCGRVRQVVVPPVGAATVISGTFSVVSKPELEDWRRVLTTSSGQVRIAPAVPPTLHRV